MIEFETPKHLAVYQGLCRFLGCVGTFIALIASASQAADPTTKPRYRLIEGQGYAVCEAFLRNLNAFSPDEPAMVCEQKIHPSTRDFSRPKWEEMDWQDNLQIIYEAEGKLLQFTPPQTSRSAFSQWEKLFQERIRNQSTKPRLRKTVIDMGVKGAETLIEYNPNDQCLEIWKQYHYVGGSSAPSTGGYIFVFDAKTGRISETVPPSLSDVWLYRGVKPYAINIYANSLEGLLIHFSPVNDRLTEEGKYVFSAPSKCVARFELKTNP